MKQHAIDVLYLLDHRNAILYGLLAAALAGVSVRLIAVHTTGQWGGRRSLDRRQRFLWPLVTRFVALADSHKRYLSEQEDVPQEKIAVISNGVDVKRIRKLDSVSRQELGIPETAFVVGNIAVLRPEKGHEILLRAAQQVLASADDVYFLVVGGGSEERRLLGKATELGIDERFRFLGFKEDAPRYISSFDVAVISSFPTVETYPLFALEAMVLGRPVISTDVGSVRDILDEGENGLIIQPGDVDQLAGAILRCYADRELVAAMGKSASEKAEREFAISKTVAQTEALLLELLSPSV
jgi:glycosyltransferase involved in cell wall biosynthesis